MFNGINMPYRRMPLVNGEVYHVFNRSVANQPIFLQTRNYQRALEVIEFYIYSRPPLSFSHYRRLAVEQRSKFLERMQKFVPKHIEILAYCLMPNHFHFLIRQGQENGVANFLRNFQNSYAKYFNTKTERSGALFQSMFKAVRIESDEQLIHVARYIHLNPSTSYIIKGVQELESYPWNSFAEYLSKQPSKIIDKGKVLGFFKSLNEFKKFTLDQRDYQRRLESVKHLFLE